MSILIDWSDKLSVGIEEIDDQHRGLVDLLNELHRAVLARRGRDTCGEILNRLAEYTRIHFAVEESLMRVLGYPDYEHHKAEHEHLIGQVQDLQDKLKHEGVNISLQLLQFLKAWLGEHIVKSDMHYGPYFLSMGVRKSNRRPSWLSRVLR